MSDKIHLNNDLLLINKPKDVTSFDVIRILRKKLGIKKMGHSGTLDPLATGLLIIGIGEGTKKLSKLIGLSKKYEAEIILGKETDSGDIYGKVIKEIPVPYLTEEKIKETLISLIGELELPVSLFSAIKKDGKPLYKYARNGGVDDNGIKIEKPIKKMIVKSADFIYFDRENNIIRVVFDVSSGTYIRSLAEELGKRLNTVACIFNLRRLSIGEYKIEDAITLDF